jgi:sodium/hydrogen exchanger 8
LLHLLVGRSIALILLGRAFNIFPLAAVVNLRRPGLLSGRMQFIMWFSGLRGAIAFALAIHLPIALFSYVHVCMLTAMVSSAT